MPSCETCRFWHPVPTLRHIDGNKGGECRNSPPVVLSAKDDAVICGWPITYDCQWCGSFIKKLRPAETAQEPAAVQ